MTIESWIEVVGNGVADETLTQHRIALTVSVRDTRLEGLANEAAMLRDRTLRTLLEAGLRTDELSEGGMDMDVFTAWWVHKKKTRSEAREQVSHRVLIACPDINRIRAGLAALEVWFQNPRLFLEVSNMSPRFEAAPEATTHALHLAIADARHKAQALAAAANATLGPVLQVEDLGLQHSRSGAYGDNDYGVKYAVLSEPSSAGPISLDPAKRQQQVQYRVRFAMTAA